MFQQISKKFEKIVHFIRGYGKLNEQNVQEAVRQIKLALLEADVHYSVVKELIESVKKRALGTEVMSSVTPQQVFVKIVYDEILKLMDEGNNLPRLYKDKQNSIILFGANGSGKTTTTVKLAKLYKEFEPLIVAADLVRPAAIDQLESLCQSNGISLFSDKKEKNPVELVKRALDKSNENKLVIYDTAGRFDTDPASINELKSMVKAVEPDYKVLVIDAGEGQKGIDLIKSVNEQVGIDHVILTKLDSDTKAGLVLSLKYQTHIPVAWMTTGEKVSDIEPFSGGRIAKMIMNIFDPDLKFLEEMKDQFEQEEAIETDASDFNFEHYLKSLSMMEKGNFLSSLMKNIPGMPAGVNIDIKELKMFRSIICSMTLFERRNPGRIEHRRRLRIAAGSGNKVQDVNILIKRFNMTKDMMRKFGKKKDVSIQDMISKMRRR